MPTPAQVPLNKLMKKLRTGESVIVLGCSCGSVSGSFSRHRLLAMARVAIALAAIVGLVAAQNVSCPSPLSGNIYSNSGTLLDGSVVQFTAFKGRVVLIANVASF